MHFLNMFTYCLDLCYTVVSFGSNQDALHEVKAVPKYFRATLGKASAMKWELLIIPFWILALYLIVLSPALLLAALTYRWNKGLLSLVHDPEVRMQAPETPLLAGLWLFCKSMGRLSPPWYVVLAFLAAVFGLHAYLSDNNLGLQFRLHWLTLHLAVEFSAILAVLSGTMLFARHVETPGRLVWVGAIWITGWWIALWIFTPNEYFQAMHKYHWGERNFTSVPTYPLVLPVYAVVMFVLCLHRVGRNLGRRPRPS